MLPLPTARKERHVDLEFGISLRRRQDDDIELAKRVLNEIVSAHDDIMADPEPGIKLLTLGESSVNCIARA